MGYDVHSCLLTGMISKQPAQIIMQEMSKQEKKSTVQEDVHLMPSMLGHGQYYDIMFPVCLKVFPKCYPFVLSIFSCHS